MRDYSEFKGPHWEAPRSLLPKVLKAVGKPELVKQAFFSSWPKSVRALVILGCTTIIIGVSTSLTLLPLSEWLDILIRSMSVPFMWVDQFWVAITALQRTVVSLLTTPCIAISVIMTAIAAAASAAIIIAGFSFLWRHDPQRSIA